MFVALVCLNDNLFWYELKKCCVGIRLSVAMKFEAFLVSVL